METCGQITCSARTRGTIGGHRRRSGCVVQPDIGDLRSGGVHGLETGTIGGFTVGTGGTIGGHRRHATFFTPSSEGASRSEGVGLHQPPPGSTRFLNAPTRLMETCGQVTCSVWTLPIRFTVGTGGTIRGQKRHDPGTIDFGGVRK